MAAPVLGFAPVVACGPALPDLLFVVFRPFGLALGAAASLFGLWCVVGAVAGNLRQKRTARRQVAGRCVFCGYDMRVTPGRCPECGRPADRRGAFRF